MAKKQSATIANLQLLINYFIKWFQCVITFSIFRLLDKEVMIHTRDVLYTSLCTHYHCSCVTFGHYDQVIRKLCTRWITK